MGRGPKQVGERKPSWSPGMERKEVVGRNHMAGWGRRAVGRRLVHFGCWGDQGQGAGETERLFVGLKRNQLRILYLWGFGWEGRGSREGGHGVKRRGDSVASEGPRKLRLISRDSEPFPYMTAYPRHSKCSPGSECLIFSLRNWPYISGKCGVRCS